MLGAHSRDAAVGQVEKAKPLPGPPCDNNKALAGSVRWGKMWSSLWCLSTLEAASCCQLKLVNFVALWPCSCQQGSPRMWFEANLKQTPPSRWCTNNVATSGWRRQAICPTGPMSMATDSWPSSNQALPDLEGAWRRLASFRHKPTDLSSKCSRGNPTQPDHAFLQNLLLLLVAPLATSSSHNHTHNEGGTTKRSGRPQPVESCQTRPGA